MKAPRHQYLTDQDARLIESVLDHRTSQRDRAYVAIIALSIAVISLLAILSVAAS